MARKFNNNTKRQEDNDDGFLKISLVNQGIITKRRRKDCPLSHVKLSDINYKNLELLNQYISERGEIVPRRISNISLKKQRALSKAIKVARNLALLSFIQGPSS